MLHILLLILKIIGITLLVILGLILLIILTVLFVPVRYGGDTKFKRLGENVTSTEGDTQVTSVSEKNFEFYALGTITWLLHLVNFTFRYSDGIGYRLKILGITFMSEGNLKKEKKTKEKKNKDKKDGENKVPDEEKNEIANPEKVTEEQSAQTEISKTDTEETDTAKTGNSKTDSSKNDTSKTYSSKTDTSKTDASKNDTSKTDSSKSDTSKADNTKADTAKADTSDVAAENKNTDNTEIKPEKSESAGPEKEKREKEKAEEKENGITGTEKKETEKTETGEAETGKTDETGEEKEPQKQSVVEKIKNIYNKTTALLDDRKIQKAYELVKIQLVRLLKAIAPRRLGGYAKYGFEDPSVTGYITAFLAAKYGSLYKLDIEPHFDEEILDGELTFKGRIFIITLVCIACKVYFNKYFKYSLKKLKSYNEDVTG